MARNDVFVHLQAEYKPLLSVLNVVLAFPSARKNGHESGLPITFFIDVEGNTITYRSGKSRLHLSLSQLELYPASCRGLRWDSSAELHMTLHAKSECHAEGDASGIFSHLMEMEKSSEGDIISVIQQCPGSCWCCGCGRPVFSQTRPFKRVLPLPSENWSDFADIWFCHKHPHISSTQNDRASIPEHVDHHPKTLVPRPGDCLVGSLYLMVDGSYLHQDTVFCSASLRLLCQGCGNFLGFVQCRKPDACANDTESQREHGFAVEKVHKIYLHAVTFTCKTKEVNGEMQLRTPQAEDTLSTCSRKVEDFLVKFLQDQSRQFTSFRFLIRSSYEEQTDQLPVLLLVWLLDQNLEVFSCKRAVGLKTTSIEVPPVKVMKLLYKGCFLNITDPRLNEEPNKTFKEWERDNTVHGFDLPQPLCEQLLSALILSTKSLPKSQRSLNGLHVGYLQFQ